MPTNTDDHGIAGPLISSKDGGVGTEAVESSSDARENGSVLDSSKTLSGQCSGDRGISRQSTVKFLGDNQAERPAHARANLSGRETDRWRPPISGKRSRSRNPASTPTPWSIPPSSSKLASPRLTELNTLYCQNSLVSARVFRTTRPTPDPRQARSSDQTFGVVSRMESRIKRPLVFMTLRDRALRRASCFSTSLRPGRERSSLRITYGARPCLRFASHLVIQRHDELRRALHRSAQERIAWPAVSRYCTCRR